MSSLALQIHLFLFAVKRPWPDMIDLSALLFYFSILLIIPLLGYVCMYVDVRAYYKALRGALVRVVFHFPELPSWARYSTPGCMQALGVKLPCTESDLKSAYRALAEKHHPDRGGDPQQFHRLRQQFEESMNFLRAHEPEFRADRERDTRRAGMR